MKTIAILTRRPGADAEAFARLSGDELLAVWRGMAVGIVRAVHGLHAGAGAALEMETASVDEAARFVDALPYVAEGLLAVQLFPLKPFSGFEALCTPVPNPQQGDRP